MYDLEALPQLSQPSANHFLYGVLLATAAMGAARVLGYQEQVVYVGPVTAALAAGTKELSDYLWNRWQVAHGQPATHGVGWRHALATAVGGALCGLAAFAAIA
jgi:hypothetical protein